MRDVTRRVRGTRGRSHRNKFAGVRVHRRRVDESAGNADCALLASLTNDARLRFDFIAFQASRIVARDRAPRRAQSDEGRNVERDAVAFDFAKKTVDGEWCERRAAVSADFRGNALRDLAVAPRKREPKLVAV